MKREKTISELVKDYLANNCSIDEMNQLFDYFNASNDEQLVKELIRKNFEDDFTTDQRMERIIDNADRRIMDALDKRTLLDTTSATVIKKPYNWKLWRYAAASVLITVAASMFILNKKADDNDKGLIGDHLYGYTNDVLPGTEKATLELSDGKKISLINGNQEFHEKDGTKIKTDSGELIYETLTATKKETQLNKLVTPKAGMFRVILADGTKVWLNAMSELIYPVKFDGHERKVILRGEAYFDVAKDKSRPFRVNAKGTVIEALGTSFNVKAYQEATVATLIEGSIKVVNKTNKAILKPGQEVIVDDAVLKVTDSNTEKSTAWKDGDFYFNMDKMTDMMNEIARWYDLEITYKGAIPDKRYTGGIGRQANLSEVLEMMKTVSGAKFEINKRKLTVDFGTN